MGCTVPGDISTKPLKRKSKQNNAGSKRNYSKKVLRPDSSSTKESHEKALPSKNAQDLTIEVAQLNSKVQKSGFSPETTDLKQNAESSTLRVCSEKSSDSSAIDFHFKALSSKNSKRLIGVDVSLNDNDMEYLVIKAAEDEYKKLKAINDELVQSITSANSKLRLYENDYKFRLEEKNLTKDIVSTFCEELLNLPHLELSVKLESILQKSNSAPEDVFLVQDEIKNILSNLFDYETEKKKGLEDALNNFPSKRRVEINEQLLRELEAEEEILNREIATLETRYSISVIQPSTSDLLTDASNNVLKPHSKHLSHEKPSTPQKEDPKLPNTKNILEEGVSNYIHDIPEDTIGASVLDNDSFDLSISKIPKDATGASILDDKSMAFSFLDIPGDVTEACFLGVDTITSPITNAPEKAVEVPADVVRDVLGQHDEKAARLPENLSSEVYRAQLYIQRRNFMAKSRSRLEKILGL